MTIFAITMGAVMGSPTVLVRMREFAPCAPFKVNGISGSAVLAVQVISTLYPSSSGLRHHLHRLPAGISRPGSPSAPTHFGVVAVYLLACIGIGLFIGVVAPNQSFATMLSMVVSCHPCS